MGVYFDSIDSSSWNLDFLGYSIDPPKLKTHTVSVPLRDGVIDMTEALGGTVRYDNRALKMRFELRDSRWQWPAKWTTIYNAIHGKLVDIKLPDDTTHKWHGRCQMAGWKDNGSTGTLEITLDAYPYKHATTSATYGPYTLSGGTRSVSVSVSTKCAFLAWQITGTITVTIGSDTLTLTAGSYVSENISAEISGLSNPKRIPDILLYSGTNTVVFGGNGTVKMWVAGGDL